MSDYDHKPDRWVMLKFESAGQITYKILGSWGGGYTQGQSWQLNSGVVKIEEEDNHYLFYGYSGSVYKCHKQSYGMTSYAMQVYNTFQKQIEESDGATMVLLPEETHFMEIEYVLDT
jgi:hypothetical protein